MTRLDDMQARAEAELAAIERRAKAGVAADRLIPNAVRVLTLRSRELIETPSSRCVTRVRQAITSLGRPASPAIRELIDQAECLCQAVDTLLERRQACRAAIDMARQAPIPEAAAWQNRADLK